MGRVGIVLPAKEIWYYELEGKFTINKEDVNLKEPAEILNKIEELDRKMKSLLKELRLEL